MPPPKRGWVFPGSQEPEEVFRGIPGAVLTGMNIAANPSVRFGILYHGNQVYKKGTTSALKRIKPEILLRAKLRQALTEEKSNQAVEVRKKEKGFHQQQNGLENAAQVLTKKKSLKKPGRFSLTFDCQIAIFGFPTSKDQLDILCAS